MAINSVVLEMVAKVARLRRAPRRMLCLGYPDMLVTEAQLDAILGPGTAAAVDWRDDSDSILGWHGLRSELSRVAETRSVLKRLEVEAEFVDIVASRGFEIVLDLNQPAPAELVGQYDIVYDGGTMEHCFNAGQVMRNILAFAKVGGFIVHVNPLNYYNHGFFNFNPTYYHDWYVQAGNGLASPIYAMHGPVTASQLSKLEPTAGFPQAPQRSTLLLAAMKVREGDPPWPMQSRYLRTPGLKA